MLIVSAASFSAAAVMTLAAHGPEGERTAPQSPIVDTVPTVARPVLTGHAPGLGAGSADSEVEELTEPSQALRLLSSLSQVERADGTALVEQWLRSNPRAMVRCIDATAPLPPHVGVLIRRAFDGLSPPSKKVALLALLGGKSADSTGIGGFALAKAATAANETLLTGPTLEALAALPCEDVPASRAAIEWIVGSQVEIPNALDPLLHCLVAREIYPISWMAAQAILRSARPSLAESELACIRLWERGLVQDAELVRVFALEGRSSVPCAKIALDCMDRPGTIDDCVDDPYVIKSSSSLCLGVLTRRYLLTTGWPALAEIARQGRYSTDEATTLKRLLLDLASGVSPDFGREGPTLVRLGLRCAPEAACQEGTDGVQDWNLLFDLLPHLRMSGEQAWRLIEGSLGIAPTLWDQGGEPLAQRLLAWLHSHPVTSGLRPGARHEVLVLSDSLPWGIRRSAHEVLEVIDPQLARACLDKLRSRGDQIVPLLTAGSESASSN